MMKSLVLLAGLVTLVYLAACGGSPAASQRGEQPTQQATPGQSAQPTAAATTQRTQASSGSPGAFTKVGDLKESRSAHTAVVLPDGRVFTAGGRGVAFNFGTGRVQTAEFFDPESGQWTLTDEMSRERNAIALAVLPDGKVLVAGGSGGGSAQYATRSAEIWDSATGHWTATADLNVPREEAATVVLKDGRVLVIGGIDDTFIPLSSVETYDAASGKWTLVAPMAVARNNHTATVLQDGRVLVVGGGKLDGPWINSAEVYDPASDTWSSAGTMPKGRSFHTVTLLKDGRVLAVGGKGKLKTAELWDPATNTWTPAGVTQQPRSEHGAGLLPDGRVIVIGGIGGLASTEIYDPSTNSWSMGANMEGPRYRFGTAALMDGRIVVFGGTGKEGVLATTEIYTP
jgi:N-acetylneuraminic acid mutarotase